MKKRHGSYVASICFAIGCAGPTGQSKVDKPVETGAHHVPHVQRADHSHAEDHAAKSLTVVPTEEKTIAQSRNLNGPTQTAGITSVVELATIPLEAEFEGLAGQEFRVRELVIAPGGVVAVHQHQQRPGIAYILEGEMVEHRSDQTGAIVRKKGDIAVERTGVSHWWENKSDRPARALVVDILPAKAP